MKQKRFEELRRAQWERLEEWLEHRDTSGSLELPARHRALCRDLSLANQRGYSPTLVGRLQRLALRTHRELYGVKAERPLVLARWFLVDIPRLIRQEWRLFLVACLAFWGTGLALGLAVAHEPHWALSWMGSEELARMKDMYTQTQGRLGRRGATDDLAMFGFYIWNNVSICFRTFAAGFFGGVLALASLAFNGVNGGIVASWLSQDPATRTNFWSFVVTHSAFEITGLELAGVAGMRLGLSLCFPGDLRRAQSLQVNARRIYPILVAAALLTVTAAFFEAFWSARGAVPPAAKYAVGGCMWALVTAWIVWGGRRHAA